jgi:hypothetical protein
MRDEMTGSWEKLHNHELHNLYSSPSIIRVLSRRMRWVWHVARVGEKRSTYRMFAGKRSLGRSRRRWVDNITIDLRKIEWGDVDWIDLAQDRDQWRTLMNLRVP